MSCSLCGHEEEKRHHLGCARIANPGISDHVLREAGLLAPLRAKAQAPESVVEVLKEGSMTTVPEEDVPAGPGETVEQCDFDGCDNPRKSAHARAKWCETHSDPKNRKD